MGSSEDLLKQALTLVPKLTDAAHKGQAGKIAVIGGCREYTGAPFFSAFATLKVGADIAHVFCTQGAAAVIKGYSPELIVHPYLPDSQECTGELSEQDRARLVDRAVGAISEWLDRFDVVVVGPGLGRDDLVLETAAKVLRGVAARKLPLVVDADGLWMVNKDTGLVRGNQLAVLTPNVVEFGRLARALGVDADGPQACMRLAEALQGPVILQKGRHDIAADAQDQVECSEPGSLRRVGGQGDVLSGCVAAFLAWIRRARGDSPERHDRPDHIPPRLLACFGASTLVRMAARQAYDDKGRAMGAGDVVAHLGPVLDVLVGDRPPPAKA